MELKTEHRDLENCQIQLEVEIPQKELKNEYEVVKQNFIKQAQLPGFRKGKIPSSIVDKRFKESIKSKVLENILPKSFSQAVDEQKLKTYGQPIAEEIGDYEDNKPLKVKFKVDKWPSVEIGNMDGIEITEDQVTINDKDIQEEINRNIQSMSTLENSSKVKKDDYVTFNINVLDEENVDLNLKDYQVQFNSPNSIPYDLFEDIKGLKEKDKRKVKKNYSKEHSNERLQGKKITFEIEILSIKELKFPELTESIAQKLNYDSVADLKDSCKKSLENIVVNHKQNQKNKAVDVLIERSDFSIPDSVVKASAHRYIDDMKAQFSNNEQVFQSYLTMQKKTLEELQKEFEKQALLNIKRELILMQLKTEYKTEVEENEIVQEIQKIADQSKKDVKQLRKEMIKSGDYTHLKNNLLANKTVDFILEKGKIKKGKSISVGQVIANNRGI